MLIQPQGLSVAGGINLMKNETVNNRTSDLPNCSAVPSIANMAVIRNGDVMLDNLNVHSSCAYVSPSKNETAKHIIVL
jgi:hypothetical protein